MADCSLRYDPIYVGSTAGLSRYRVLSGGRPLPIDAGDIASITLRVTDPDSGDVVIAAGAGSVVDGPNGVVGYQRVPADVAAAYPNAIAHWTIVWLSGDEHVSPPIAYPILAAN